MDFPRTEGPKAHFSNTWKLRKRDKPALGRVPQPESEIETRSLAFYILLWFRLGGLNKSGSGLSCVYFSARVLLQSRVHTSTGLRALFRTVWEILCFHSSSRFFFGDGWTCWLQEVNGNWGAGRFISPMLSLLQQPISFSALTSIRYRSKELFYSFLFLSYDNYSENVLFYVLYRIIRIIRTIFF